MVKPFNFRWSKTANGEWLGIISGYVCSLKQDTKGNLLYLFHKSTKNGSRNEEGTLPTKRQKKMPRKPQNTAPQENNGSLLNHESILTEYLNLEFPLEEHYISWSKVDENFKKVGQNYKGIRILRQDPVENLFSFICSANNNIPRYIKEALLKILIVVISLEEAKIIFYFWFVKQHFNQFYLKLYFDQKTSV